MDFNLVVKDGKCKFVAMYDDGDGAVEGHITVNEIDGDSDVYKGWRAVLDHSIRQAKHAGFTLVAIGLLPVSEWEDQ